MGSLATGARKIAAAINAAFANGSNPVAIDQFCSFAIYAKPLRSFKRKGGRVV